MILININSLRLPRYVMLNLMLKCPGHQPASQLIKFAHNGFSGYSVGGKLPTQHRCLRTSRKLSQGKNMVCE